MAPEAGEDGREEAGSARFGAGCAPASPAPAPRDSPRGQGGPGDACTALPARVGHPPLPVVHRRPSEALPGTRCAITHFPNSSASCQRYCSTHTYHERPNPFPMCNRVRYYTQLPAGSPPPPAAGGNQPLSMRALRFSWKTSILGLKAFAAGTDLVGHHSV